MLKLVLPLLLINLLVRATPFILFMLLGRYSVLSLASGAVSGIVALLTVVLFGTGFFALNALVSRAYAHRDTQEIAAWIQQASVVAWCFGMVAWGFLWSSPTWLAWLPLDVSIVHTSAMYLTKLAWLMPFELVGMALQQSLMGMNQQWAALWGTLFGFLCLLLGWWLLHPALTLSYPHYVNRIVSMQALQVGGALLAFVTIFIGSKICRPVLYAVLTWPQSWRPAWRIIRYGIPVSLDYTIGTLFGLGLVMIASKINHEALAIRQIVNQYSMVIFLLTLAVSQAATIDIARAVRSVRHYVWLMLAGMGVLAGVFWIGRHTFVSWYLPHGPQHLAIVMLELMLVAQVFLSIRSVLTGALRGKLHMKTPFVVNACCLFLVVLPLAYLLAIPLHYGLYGLAWGEIVGLGLNMFLMMGAWWYWERKGFMRIG